MQTVSMAASACAMVAKLLVVVTVLFNVANCFSLMAASSNAPDPGTGGILLPPVSSLEEGRPTGPSRSDVVRAWLRALMTSWQAPSSSESRGVQRRMVLDDTDEDVGRNDGVVYPNERQQQQQQPAIDNWQSTVNVRPTGHRKPGSKVSLITDSLFSCRPIFSEFKVCLFNLSLRVVS